MSRYASGPIVFKQNTAPDQTADLVPTPGDIWIDQSQSPPVVKKCTGIYPFVWASIEGGGSSINFSDAETPSGSINGSINGSNVTFALAHSPVGSSLQLHQNGITLTGGGVDYTLSGSTITMTSAPVTNDTLIAWYRF